MTNVSKSFLDKLYVPTQLIATVPKKELLMVLPFVGKSSVSMRTRLYKSVSKLLPHSNIKVVSQSKNRLSNLFKFKDSVALYLRTHLICKCQCSNCNFADYCEIERHLKARTGERTSLSTLTEERVNNNKKLAVKYHCLLSGHECSFDDFAIFN